MDFVASSSKSIIPNSEPFDFFKSKDEESLKTIPFFSFLSLEPCKLEENSNSCNKVEDDEDVTVALHIGLPNQNDNTIVVDDNSYSNNNNTMVADMPANVEYWIPSRSQILAGFTHFSCHICKKTFNRHNNLQVIPNFLNGVLIV